MKALNVFEQIRAAYRCATPLVYLVTADAAAATAKVVEMAHSEPGPKVPVYGWDIARGVRPLCKVARENLWTEPGEASQGPVDFLTQAQAEGGAPAKSIIVAHNLHRHMDNSLTLQAIWNARDVFKADRRMLLMVGPLFTLPEELRDDVIVLEEPLPTEDEIRAQVGEAAEAAKSKYKEFSFDPEVERKAVSALRGLAAFPAEQVAFMSLMPEGFDIEALWDHKRVAIDRTFGLSMIRPKRKFADIGGLEQIKTTARRRQAGPMPVSCFVRVDEIEKSLAGAQGDTSGTSQDQLNVLLQTMQDEGWDGCVLVGPPGSAKSLYSQAVGNEFGVPTLNLDLGGLKGSLVGESEGRIRQAMRVIKATGGSGVYFVATCNKLDVIPPELKRRFLGGIWYCGLPDEGEKQLVWNISTARYKLDVSDPKVGPLPPTPRWTGSDIETCCRNAYSQGITLLEASKTFIPVAQTDPAAIERLEEMAHGRFLSVSRPGNYEKRAAPALATNSKRALA